MKGAKEAKVTHFWLEINREGERGSEGERGGEGERGSEGGKAKVTHVE